MSYWPFNACYPPKTSLRDHINWTPLTTRKLQSPIHAAVSEDSSDHQIHPSLTEESSDLHDPVHTSILFLLQPLNPTTPVLWLHALRFFPISTAPSLLASMEVVTAVIRTHWHHFLCSIFVTSSWYWSRKVCKVMTKYALKKTGFGQFITTESFIIFTHGNKCNNLFHTVYICLKSFFVLCK